MENVSDVHQNVFEREGRTRHDPRGELEGVGGYRSRLAGELISEGSSQAQSGSVGNKTVVEFWHFVKIKHRRIEKDLSRDKKTPFPRLVSGGGLPPFRRDLQTVPRRNFTKN